MYNLFLDDERDLFQAFNISRNKDYLTKQWVIVRSYESFCKIIQERGLPLLISFDHDLGKEKDGSEKNGYDCAKHLVEYCLDHNCFIPLYLIHSANPVGRLDIKFCIDNYNSYFKMEK